MDFHRRMDFQKKPDLSLNVNEEEIIRNVETIIKKNGTFDKIKKETTDRLKACPELLKIENEIQDEIDAILTTYGHLPKEDIQKLVRSKIQQHSRLTNEINRQAKIELDKPENKIMLFETVRDKIGEELERYK